MYKNEVVSGGIYMESCDYANGTMFRELPPVPMRKNDGPTDVCETESCFRKNWSLTSKVLLLGLVGLLSILLITAFALFSAAPVQAKEEKQANKNIPVKEPVKVTCPVSWNRRGDSCYFFSIETETWEGAFSRCTQQQSKLVILRSIEEMNSLLPLINGKTYWFGLKKFHTTWLWYDATPLNFSNWGLREPNNTGGNEFCVEMKSDGWNDVHCDLKMHYICKK
ncbi:CD209 antigen-like protein C isoform X2 [Eleutherodactylus coqui]|uniref:CD209 antigen-like protein C isoform X2 n=1 Tax=Eleutherodactylus coqui TaxID=57060 RepID=UPI003462568C